MHEISFVFQNVRYSPEFTINRFVIDEHYMVQDLLPNMFSLSILFIENI